MKQLALLGAVAVLATAAFAEKKPAETPKQVECPIMKGHKVEIAEATKKKAFADYKGNRYFFCCAGCAPEFKKNPEKYAKAPHIPTPKTK